MTISMIDLLKRARPFVITALPLVALAACDPKETNAAFDRVDAALTGSPIPQEPYTLAAVPSSSEEPVVVEAVAPSSSVEPPPCENYLFRSAWYTCAGVFIGYQDE